MMWGQISRLPATRQFLDPLVIRLPIVGALQRSISLSRFLRVLAHLYRGGIPLPEAWQLSAATASNEAIAGPLRAQQGIVATNVPVSQVLAATRLFPPDSVAAVATGEQTGQLDAMLFRLADYEDQAVDRAARSYPTFMRVVMLLCMAPVIILVLQHFWTGYFNTIMKWSDGS
jgi:type II secretory pathway component PulF